MIHDLLAVRAMSKFNLSSLSELWIRYIFDLLLAHALRRIREELLTLVIILVSRRIFKNSRVVLALPRIVITLEGYVLSRSSIPANAFANCSICS